MSMSASSFPAPSADGAFFYTSIYLSKFHPRWLLGRFIRLLRSGTGFKLNISRYFRFAPFPGGLGF